jgi:hypothetical protein
MLSEAQTVGNTEPQSNDSNMDLTDLLTGRANTVGNRRRIEHAIAVLHGADGPEAQKSLFQALASEDGYVEETDEAEKERILRVLEETVDIMPE